MNKIILHLFFSILLVSTLTNSSALKHINKSSKSQQTFIPNPPTVKATSYIIIDANSDTIIAEKNSHTLKGPASLTKMLSLYVISDYLTRGEINLDDQVKISTRAWKTGGSRTFVKEGQYVSVESLIKGVIVQSGNDACIALAEHIAGNTDAFVSLMNQQAKILGMSNSHFTDPIGMPHEKQKSTAYDLAILTKALIKNYPQFYHWYQQKWFTFNDIKQANRNRLLWRLNYIDGVKTGHTKTAGYSQASSGVKNGMRLIVVALGSSSDESRAQDGKKLFTYAYRFFESHSLYEENKKISQTRVWYGKKPNIAVGVGNDLYITIPSGTYKSLKAKLKINKNIKAPVKKRQVIGQLEISFDDNIIHTNSIIALEDSDVGNIGTRILDSIKYAFHSLSSKFT